MLCSMFIYFVTTGRERPGRNPRGESCRAPYLHLSSSECLLRSVLRAPCQPQLSFVRLRSKSGRSSGAAESPLQRRGPHPGDAQVSTSRTRGVSRDTCQRMSHVHYGCSHVTHSSMYWIFIVDADLDSYAPVPVPIPARERV